MILYNPDSPYILQHRQLFWVHATPENEAIILAQAKAAGIYCFNVGAALATFLQGYTGSKYITMDTQEELARLLQAAKQEAHIKKLHTLGLYNLGLLLEPALALDAGHIIKAQAKDFPFILIWDGLSDNLHSLHWSPEDAVKLHFPNQTLQQVILPHAV